MTADPQTKSSPRLALYGLTFRILRAAWSLGEGAGLPAGRAECRPAPDLPDPVPRRFELEPVQGSPPRPEGV